MGTKVEELMSANVISTNQHKTTGHAKTMLKNNKINSLPVVDDLGEPIGVVSHSDLAQSTSETQLISAVMSEKVYTIPAYSDTQLAARMMRNHKIHHLIVTNEKKLVGIISSFDLLKLVEERKYVSKQPATPSKKSGKRAKVEL